MAERLTTPEIAALCTNPAEGCFADNEYVLGMMIDMDDVGVRKHLEDSGLWGFRHAQNEVELKGLNINGKPILTVETGLEGLGRQAALCGYSCGAIAAGQCAVFKPTAFKPSVE